MSQAFQARPSNAGHLNAGALGAAGLGQAGAVLGVDVGFSRTRRSSAVCSLGWSEHQVTWKIQRFRALPEEQKAAITAVAGRTSVTVAAFDGPLRKGFDVIGRYRVAERMLTRRLGATIGKPGQASAPVGKALNEAANDCVGIVLRELNLALATHYVRIDERAVVEAFPSAFLGMMLSDPAAVVARRADRSDTFFRRLVQDGTLEALLRHLLPGRSMALSLDEITNHDDRAALVCALTALCVAAGDFTATGGADGWIILPPRRFVQEWAWADLEANMREEASECLYKTQIAA